MNNIVKFYIILYIAFFDNKRLIFLDITKTNTYKSLIKKLLTFQV